MERREREVVKREREVKKREDEGRRAEREVLSQLCVYDLKQFVLTIIV